MRITSLLAIFTLISLTAGGQSLQPSGILGTCQSGGNPSYPNCNSGEVTFAGSTTNTTIHVLVTNSSGAILDDADYDTTGGNFNFTENLSVPDTYSVTVDQQQPLFVTTS